MKISGHQRKIEKWERPPENMYKINIDGSFKDVSSNGGWGFIVRDNSGQFLEGGCGNLMRVPSPLQAEHGLHCTVWREHISLHYGIQ